MLELSIRISGATVFTRLNLKGAYYFVCLKKGDKWKTAFDRRSRLFDYIRMPSGLAYAPSIFQNRMNEVHQEFFDQQVVVYLDDIVIYSSSQHQHAILVR